MYQIKMAMASLSGNQLYSPSGEGSYECLSRADAAALLRWIREEDVNLVLGCGGRSRGTNREFSDYDLFALSEGDPESLSELSVPSDLPVHLLVRRSKWALNLSPQDVMTGPTAPVDPLTVFDSFIILKYHPVVNRIQSVRELSDRGYCERFRHYKTEIDDLLCQSNHAEDPWARLSSLRLAMNLWLMFECDIARISSYGARRFLGQALSEANLSTSDRATVRSVLPSSIDDILRTLRQLPASTESKKHYRQVVARQCSSYEDSDLRYFLSNFLTMELQDRDLPHDIDGVDCQYRLTEANRLQELIRTRIDERTSPPRG